MLAGTTTPGQLANIVKLTLLTDADDALLKHGVGCRCDGTISMDWMKPNQLEFSSKSIPRCHDGLKDVVWVISPQNRRVLAKSCCTAWSAATRRFTYSGRPSATVSSRRSGSANVVRLISAIRRSAGHDPQEQAQAIQLPQAGLSQSGKTNEELSIWGHRSC